MNITFFSALEGSLLSSSLQDFVRYEHNQHFNGKQRVRQASSRKHFSPKFKEADKNKSFQVPE